MRPRPPSLMIALLAGESAIAAEEPDATADAEAIDEVTVYGERELARRAD